MSGTLRMDRMPHIWCPGCGIGSEVNSFAEAVKRSGIDPKKLVVVSGIGCTGRVAGYVNFDSIHTTHGRAIPVATGIKLANPELTVVVFSGEGDLAGIGGNHLIHAARRNMDLVVICNNNFTYGMTGGQVTPTTPGCAIASTTPYGNYEYPFSLPFLMDAAGATYIARWTSMHSRNVTQSIEEALLRKGFSFIEIISPCTDALSAPQPPRRWRRQAAELPGKLDSQAWLRHPRDGYRLPGQDRHRQVRRKEQAYVSGSRPTSAASSWSGTIISSTARPFPNGRPRKKPRRRGSPLAAPRWQQRKRRERQ